MINLVLTVIQPDWKVVKQFYTNHFPHLNEDNKIEIRARRIKPLPGDNTSIQLDLYCPCCDTLTCTNYGRYNDLDDSPKSQGR